MTAGEKAREYADETYPNTDSNDYSRTTAEEWDACYDGYMGGYNEAMRWRDPEVDQPENGEPVIVKYMTARGIKKYGIAKYFELGIGNPWTIEGSTGREVIGWRPIE